MSTTHNSIQCTHGLGLDWEKTRKAMGLDDKAITEKLVGGPPVLAPTIPPQIWPHHGPLRMDE